MTEGFREPVVVMDAEDAAFRLLRQQYNDAMALYQAAKETIDQQRVTITELTKRLEPYEDIRVSESHLALAKELLAQPGLERTVAQWLTESGL